jgi:cold shock protein
MMRYKFPYHDAVSVKPGVFMGLAATTLTTCSQSIARRRMLMQPGSSTCPIQTQISSLYIPGVRSPTPKPSAPATTQSTFVPRRINDMAKGTVKWFNPTKGYGFIQPQGGGKDVFVHISAVEKAGLTTLNEGQAVEYEEMSNRGKTSAENLKVQR